VFEVVRRFECRGFTFIKLELRQLTSEEVDRHYQEHVARDFYPRLKEFILSGPILIMVLEGERVVDTIRKMVGVTDSLDAEPGTIRGDLSLDKGENVVHASDSVESAEREIENFFGTLLH
jgi:nucleoside-diphosphate kinase